MGDESAVKRQGPPKTVYNVLIPLTNGRTNTFHDYALFDEWRVTTAEKFGGITDMGFVRGWWLKELSIKEKQLVDDLSVFYKVAVPPGDIPAFMDHIKKTAVKFAQECIFLEKAGTAELIET